MKTKPRNSLIIVTLILGFIILRFVKPELFIHNESVVCFEMNSTKGVALNAVVERKYLDYSNHNYPAVEFRSLIDKRLIKVHFINERGGFYTNIQIGDTVVKASGSLDVFSSNKTLHDSLVYNCNE